MAAAAAARMDRHPVDETDCQDAVFKKMETVSIRLEAMTAFDQNIFLKQLETALCDVPENLRKTNDSSTIPKNGGGRHHLERIQQRTKKEQLALLDRMVAESRAINLNVLPVKDTDTAGALIQQLAESKQPEQGTTKHVVAWQHPLVKRLNLEKRLKESSVPVYVSEFSSPEEKTSRRKKITSAFMGVTSADFCIADSATLVLKTRPGQARSVSLAPSIHVAIVSLEQVLADLNELYALLKYDSTHQAEGLTRCLTFITGPSKTADIEATMVYGVHGPCEVYIYVITG
jgi:L-lactate dehydrogenase complex protein LldG